MQEIRRLRIRITALSSAQLDEEVSGSTRRELIRAFLADIAACDELARTSVPVLSDRALADQATVLLGELAEHGDEKTARQAAGLARSLRLQL